MTHVTGRLAAWLGGELDAAGAAAVREHLADCPACRGEAERLRAEWDRLGEAAVTVRADLWPGIRARTFARGGSGWFFGRSPLVRAALAAATLALGVLGGRLSGGLAGPRAATVAAADDDGGLAAVWLEDSTWHEDAEGGLGGTWLALAGAAGTQGDDGQGGTR